MNEAFDNTFRSYRNSFNNYPKFSLITVTALCDLYESTSLDRINDIYIELLTKNGET